MTPRVKVLSGNRRVVLFHGQEHAPGYLKAPQWTIAPCAVAVVEYLPRSNQAPDCSAVLLTSKAAAAWFCRQPLPEMIVVASGNGTAGVLMACGKKVVVPDGDLGARAALQCLVGRVPRGSRILYPCGERTAGTAEQAAVDLGFDLIPLPVYRLQASFNSGPLGIVHAVCFGSGQIVEFARTALGHRRWQILSHLPALVLGATARVALSDWKGCVFDLEKTAIQPGSFCIPFALTSEMTLQPTPVLDLGTE